MGSQADVRTFALSHARTLARSHTHPPLSRFWWAHAGVARVASAVIRKWWRSRRPILRGLDLRGLHNSCPITHVRTISAYGLSKRSFSPVADRPITHLRTAFLRVTRCTEINTRATSSRVSYSGLRRIEVYEPIRMLRTVESWSGKNNLDKLGQVGCGNSRMQRHYRC
jgi:hypothetical protein